MEGQFMTLEVISWWVNFAQSDSISDYELLTQIIFFNVKESEKSI